MNKEESKKAFQGAKTLQNFCQQFGEDIYAEILLEELFKGLMENEIVYLFGEQKTEGSEVNHDSKRQKDSKNPFDKRQNS